MDFTLTEEQKQIKTLIRDFGKGEIDLDRMWGIAQKVTEVKDVAELRAIQPWDLIEKMHELGLRQLCVPEKYGGGGFTVGHNLTRVIAGEEAGYSGALTARLLTKDWQTCAVIAGRNTTEEQKDWFFPRFMENPVGLCAHCQSEPGGTTDILLPYDEPGVAMKVYAHKEGNEWVINGDKMFSSGGDISQFIFTAARTDKNAPVTEATTLFWVLKDTPGLSQELNKMIISDIYGNCQTHFDNVRIPEAQLIGEVNKGYALLEDLIATKMVAFSHSLGASQKLYEQVVDYAKERVQGGKPIIQHTHIAALLGELAIKLESTRALLYRAAWETDQLEMAGAPRNVFWSVACFWRIKKLGLRLAEIASEIYGGIGGSVDLPLANFVRYLYMMLPGGESPQMNAIKCSMSYNNHTLGEPWKST